MEFIATYWYIWLVLMFVGYGTAMVNQVSRFKKIERTFKSSTPVTDFTDGAFFKGIGTLFVAGWAGFVGMVLLIIAIVLKIAHSLN